MTEEQRTALKAFVDGKDAFTLLPPGFSKSLINKCIRFGFSESSDISVLATDDHDMG